jgi:Domain of unknown function (DUF4145)
MNSFPWTCPYCNRDVTLVDENISVHNHYFSNNNKDGKLVLVTTVLVCPNMQCKEYSITASLNPWEWKNGKEVVNYTRTILRWNLKPQSSAKPFPDYIPKPIIDDYSEACLIKDFSPKASATLSRRCLQGMIRNFWGISKSRLVDEISALQDKIDTLTWEAVDGLRKIGNIGAHMEKDINIITDVEPHEADLLIGLIENLIKDWYISKHDKEERYKKIADITK